ncbi:MAG: peptidoglycan recognition protein family protein [Phycisphaerae bacterium]|nr:peptidoglycan recognition protein family protein [Phycisphaerae bacterium]
MIDSRTTKVLGALLVSMTIGSLLLMALESEPPRPSQNSMASIRSAVLPASFSASRPWRRVVVHSSADPRDQLPQRCHFIVRQTADASGRRVLPTKLWSQQEAGQHVYVPGHDFNADSIGICIIGDFSTRAPSRKQMETLISLVNELQRKLDIPADSVYLQSELNPDRNLPGKAFPVGEFNASLHRNNE